MGEESIRQICIHAHFALKTDSIRAKGISPWGRSCESEKDGKLAKASSWELMDQNYPRHKVWTRADKIAFFPPNPFSLPSFPSPPLTHPASQYETQTEKSICNAGIVSDSQFTPIFLCSCSCAWWRDKLIFFRATASILLKEYIKTR